MPVKSFVLIALLMIMPGLPAMGQEPLPLEPGQLHLLFSLNEQVEVDQDLLNASLQYLAQGRDRRAIQHEVNLAMQQARELLSSQNTIEFSISPYHVNTVQAGRPSRADIENPVWRARQSITMKAADSGALLELAGKLQESGFTMGSLYYSLSDASYETVADTLMVTILQKLQGRADTAAGVLGKSRAEIIEVNLNGSQGFFARSSQPMMAMDAEAAFAAPVAEPGKAQVSLSASARVLLSP